MSQRIEKRHTDAVVRRLIRINIVDLLTGPNYILPSGNEIGKDGFTLMDALESIRDMTESMKSDRLFGVVTDRTNTDLEMLKSPVTITKKKLMKSIQLIINDILKRDAVNQLIYDAQLASMKEQIKASEKPSFKEELEAEFERVEQK